MNRSFSVKKDADQKEATRVRGTQNSKDNVPTYSRREDGQTQSQLQAKVNLVQGQALQVNRWM